ncbi:MAG: PAS domain-containing protein, partial [Thermoflexibacteraceae bacterium]
KSYPLLSYKIGMHVTTANLPEGILQKWLLDNQQALLSNKTQFGEYAIEVGHEVYHYETQTVRYRKDLVLKIVRDVTNRKKVEEQFRTESNRRHAILRAIPDILFLMNGKGDYLDYKGGSGEILMNPNNVVGKSIKDSIMPKEIVEQILQTNQKALATGNLQLLEYSLKIEGEERYYESRTLMYAPQQVLRIVRDITEQKKVLQENLQLIVELQILNEELATSSEEIRQTLDNTVALNETIAKRELYYKALLEVSPDILLCVNENRQIEFMHVPDTHLAEGTELEDFLGKDFLDMEIEPTVREKALQAFNYVLETGRRTSYEAVVQHPTLGQRYYDSYYAPIVASGEVISIYILIKDITSTKENEDKLRNINKDLIRQNNQLAHYSYVVSHNLRSPVASILGLVNLLTYSNTPDYEQKELLTMLNTAAQRLDEVVKDLNYILSETQIVEENKETVHFDIEVNSIMLQLQPQIKKCGAEIHYDFQQAPTIMASKAFIHNVLLNVITNSLKFRRANIITQIAISTNIVDNYICLKIIDNGTGIDLATQGENVFKLYKRFHPNIEGKGIGLYILKTQVEIQGGKVEIESEVDVGTTLNIYFLKES